MAAYEDSTWQVTTQTKDTRQTKKPWEDKLVWHGLPMLLPLSLLEMPVYSDTHIACCSLCALCPGPTVLLATSSNHRTLAGREPAASHNADHTLPNYRKGPETFMLVCTCDNKEWTM